MESIKIAVEEIRAEEEYLREMDEESEDEEEHEEGDEEEENKENEAEKDQAVQLKAPPMPIAEISIIECSHRDRSEFGSVVSGVGNLFVSRVFF